MATLQAICHLDDTWDEVLGEYKAAIQGQTTWSSFCLDGVDKEVILSAPEIMDPKTDSGFGYQDVCSLQHLLDTQAIPPASTLGADEVLLSVMDYIHVRELNYLRGFSLVQGYLSFSYFLRLDLLKDQNPVLYAYCRGVLRSLDAVLRAVFATTIRSEEEFMVVPPELNREVDCSVEEILAELEAAAMSTKSEAVASRLRFRKHFLGALTLFMEAKVRTDVEKACDLCEEARQLLLSEAFQRTSEPAVDPNFLREKEMSFWVSVTTPTTPIPTEPFQDAMAVYQTMLSQLTSIKQLLSLTSLPSISDFVESLGAQQPLLPMRSIAVVVLFSSDPNESFLYGLPLPQRLLEMLAKDYGAPLYLKIFEGDEHMVESVLRYRIHKAADPRKMTPESLMFMRHQTVDSVRRWTSEAGKNYLVYLETMLCNRGLAHRRLVNSLASLGQLQEMSYSTDMNIFQAALPGPVAAEVEAECVRSSTVLTTFANSYVLRTLELIVQFQLELDLLTQGELVPALWYLNFAQRAQDENFSVLCLQNTSFVPETRINKKTRVPLYNLALTTRKTGTADMGRVAVLETSRMLSDSTFLAACLMEQKNLIDLTSGPAHSLTTVESVFNHRMRKCFEDIHHPPFTPYAHCMSAKPDLCAVASKIPDCARKTAAVAANAAAKARAALTSSTIGEVRRESLRSSLEGLEKTAKAVSASLLSLAALCEEPDTMKEYEAVVERPSLPHLLNFTLRKRHST